MTLWPSALLKPRTHMRHTTLKFFTLLAFSALLPIHSHATTVQVQTNLGDFEIVLFDTYTPVTVSNFLDYVEAEAYKNSIIHRFVEDFVAQGGGFRLDETGILRPIPTNDPVDNEALFSNEAYTVAMAKSPSNPNSATSQWFINLDDNGDNLDYQNGGFTVFGRVVSGRLAVVDAISALNTLNFDIFPNLPLMNYTQQDALNNTPIERENYVIVQDIVVLDVGISLDGVALPAQIPTSTPTPTPTPEPEADERIEGVGSSDKALFTLLFLLLTCSLGRKHRAL